MKRASGEDFAFESLMELAEEEGEASALVIIDGKAYQSVMLPLLAPMPIAWIHTGFLIDDKLARDLESLSNLHVSFMVRLQDGAISPLASTIPENLRQGTGR